MLHRIARSLLILSALVLAGCGGSDPDIANPMPNPGAGTASIQVDHVLARAVPATIDSFRFTCTNDNGQVVYGPLTRPRAASILLTGVPLTASTLLIDYLEDEVVVGRFQTAIELSAGEVLVINDPAWVDVDQFGPATQLDISSQPSVGAPGVVLNPPLRVEVLDAEGRLVNNFNGPITVSVASGPATGTLSGTLTVNAVNGVATFSDLVFDRPGALVLQASSAALTSVSTNPIAIEGTPVASALEFLIEPSSSAAVLSNVQVQVVDQYGDPFTPYFGTVTLALGTNTTGASLVGDLSATFSNGVATFNNILVTLPGTGYTLIASHAGLTPATSAPFSIERGQLSRAAASLVVPLAAAGSATTVGSGDFNGDGILDAVLADQGEAQIFVLLGNESGDYDKSSFSAPDVALVRTGDVTGDGEVDLVTVKGGSTPAVDLHVGDGNGEFAAPLSTAMDPTFVAGPDFAVSDLDGNGRADVVVLGSDSGNPAYYVLLSSGSSLAAPVRTGLSFAPEGLALGQLSGSTSPDLVLTRATGDVLTYTGAGNGTFNFQLVVSGTTAPKAAVIADFNNDGNGDFAVTDLGTVASVGVVQVQVYLGGGGTFTLAQGSPYLGEFATFPTSRQLAAGDYNNDGVSDLSYVDNSGQLNILVADPGAAAMDPLFADQTSGLAGQTPTDLVVGDFNGDGNLDTVVSAEQGDLIRLNGDGEGRSLPLPQQGDNTNSVAKGDVNGDGREDLVTNDASSVYVYLRTAAGAIASGPDLTFSLSEGLETIVLADFDADGDLDLGGSNASASGVLVYRNPGTGNFSTTSELIDMGTGLARLQVGDLNDDGFPDVAGIPVASPGLVVALSSGELTYSSTTLYSSTQISDVGLSDLENDGDLDIVTAQNAAGVGLVTNADGVLSAQTPFVSSVNAVAVAAGDLNGDGLDDLVVASDGDSTDLGRVLVLQGDGEGGFENPLTIVEPGLRDANLALIGDANGDGANDILVSDSETFGCVVLTGSGDGVNFAGGSQVHAGVIAASPTSLVLVDLDGDGIALPFFAGATVTNAGGTAVTLLTFLSLVALRARRRRRETFAA